MEFNDGLLRHAPRWLAAYLAYAEAPARDGPLTPRLRELIYVAVDASTTHMFSEGLHLHVDMALKAGCTPGELIEVMQIATLQGLDSVVAGAEILAEEAPAAGLALPATGNGGDLLQRYEAARGDRPAWLGLVAAMAPRYAEALMALIEVAEEEATLTARERALIRLALAASPTSLNRSAMRTETRAALRAGAAPEDVLEVFQLVAHLGIHACVDGVPAVLRASG